MFQTCLLKYRSRSCQTNANIAISIKSSHSKTDNCAILEQKFINPSNEV